MKEEKSCGEKLRDRIREDMKRRENDPEVKFRRESKEKLEKLETKIDVILDTLRKITDNGTS